jgi:hypothetical protein
MAVLPTLAVMASAQTTEQAARELASNTVRSELHSRVDFKSDQFLQVQRDEELEQSLAVAVAMSTPSSSVFIYRASETGYEISAKGVRYHFIMDGDYSYIVAVRPADGIVYRIHGFGLKESLAEFEKLMKETNIKVSSSDQAEAVVDFYRKVNPDNFTPVPILSLIDLKQTAERQCQTNSFDADERKFDAWWKDAKRQYADIPFKQTATRSGDGYIVQWTILSSAGHGACGGVPLRESLEVSSDGHVREMASSPVQKSSH